MSGTDHEDYIWDRSGKPDPEILELTSALSPLRAPPSQRLARRRWLVPAVFGVLATLALVVVVVPTQLPPQVVGLVSGESGINPVMIEGGARAELDVLTTGDQKEASDRLVELFENKAFREYPGSDPIRIYVRYASPERLIVEVPGYAADYEMTSVLESHKLARNLALTVEPRGTKNRRTTPAPDGTLVRNFAITGARVADGGLRIEITAEAAATLRAALAGDDQLVVKLTSLYNGGYTTRGSGTLDGNVVSFPLDADSSRRWADRIAPDSDVLVEIVSMQVLGPSLTGGQKWAARVLFAGFGGLLVFCIAAIAGRRVRRLDPLVDRSRARRGRRGVFAAVGLTLVAIALGLIYTDQGPVGGSLISVFESPSDGDMPFAVGAAPLFGGFLLALLASVLVRPWRRAMICDGRAGATFVRRGLIAAGLLASLALIAPLFEGQLNYLTAAWDTGSAIGFTAVALGLTAAAAAIGRFALGGPWLCVVGAWIAAGGYHVGTRFITNQHDGLGAGTVAVVALVIAAVAGLTAVLLSRPRGSTASPVLTPLGGIAPFVLPSFLAALLATLNAVDLGVHRFPALFVGCGAVGLVALLAWLERSRYSLGPASINTTGDNWRPLFAGVAITTVWLGALIAVDSLSVAVGGPPVAALTAIGTALIMDLIAELRARRRRPQLRPAWSLHHPQLAPLIERALDGQGFDVHLRGRYTRGCLGILGVFVPITAMVDRDRIDEARELIAATLGCSDVGE